MMRRARLRDLGITIGELPTGPLNAMTDVEGVLVGHTTLIWDEPRTPALHPQRGASVARTGVTVIVPRSGTAAGGIWNDHAFAGFYSFNGNGEMTGLPWIEESGMLTTPIALTNTHAVGIARDALVAYGVEKGYVKNWVLPVAAETYDGFLNDINAFHVTREHVYAALDSAASGVVAEGNVGGGTGMRCHGFKGGIGTSSRRIALPDAEYMIGVLVQANYGRMRDLRVGGVPIGRMLEEQEDSAQPRGSIIVIMATDAPLLPVQCKRLARRATVGLARVGGLGLNSSGDLFLAFATGNHLPRDAQLYDLKMLPHEQMDPFFQGAAESVEEAILNALTMAETMTGFKGTVHALPLAQLKSTIEQYRRA